MAKKCITIKSFTRGDGAKVKEHERCFEVKPPTPTQAKESNNALDSIFDGSDSKASTDTSKEESSIKDTDTSDKIVDALTEAPSQSSDSEPDPTTDSTTDPTTDSTTTNEVGPIDSVVSSSDSYKKKFGIDTPDPEKIKSVDKARSVKIASAYEAMEHLPNDPKVKASYKAMIKETVQQYDHIVSEGLVVERWTGEGEPYKNSKEMLSDIRNNNTLKFLPSEGNFGEGEVTDGNIGLDPSGRIVDGVVLSNSEVFRVVHDYYGHGKLGNGFGAVGEENAALQHSSMFSDKARPAMLAQTRGQNSWVNFSGENNESIALFEAAARARKNGDYDLAEAISREGREKFSFAEPKIGLLPEEFDGGGVVDGTTTSAIDFRTNPDGDVKAKDGYVLMYHKTTSKSNAQSILDTGLKIGKKKIVGDPSDKMWLTKDRTGYSKKGSLIALQIPEDKLMVENSSAGIYSVIGDVPKEDILKAYNQIALGGTSNSTRREDVVRDFFLSTSEERSSKLFDEYIDSHSSTNASKVVDENGEPKIGLLPEEFDGGVVNSDSIEIPDGILGAKIKKIKEDNSWTEIEEKWIAQDLAAKDWADNEYSDETSEPYDVARKEFDKAKASLTKAYSANQTGELSDFQKKMVDRINLKLQDVGNNDVWHFSINGSSVEKYGLLTKDELREVFGDEVDFGVGGGQGISTTYDESYANSLFDTFTEMKGVYNGDVDISASYLKLKANHPEKAKEVVNSIVSMYGIDAISLDTQLSNNVNAPLKKASYYDKINGKTEDYNLDKNDFIKRYFNALTMFDPDREWLALEGSTNMENWDLAIFKGRTVDGAKGEVWPAEREYRVFSGSAIEDLTEVKSTKIKSLTIGTKYSDMTLSEIMETEEGRAFLKDKKYFS